ncbi:MAG: hypothetical protein HY791_32100 [Deltaproteobacteria bacterium]|nr:hypothetical protein [Deltaproteobacteria bacterium]
MIFRTLAPILSCVHANAPPNAAERTPLSGLAACRALVRLGVAATTLGAFAACSRSEFVHRSLSVGDGLGFFIMTDRSGSHGAARGPVVIENGVTTSGQDQIPDEELDSSATQLHFSWLEKSVVSEALAASGHGLDEARLSEAKTDFDRSASCTDPTRVGGVNRLRLSMLPGAKWQTAQLPTGEFEEGAAPGFEAQMALELPILRDPCSLPGVTLRPFAGDGFLFPRVSDLPLPENWQGTIDAGLKLRQVIRLSADEVLTYAGSAVYLVSRDASKTATVTPLFLRREGGVVLIADAAIDRRGSTAKLALVGQLMESSQTLLFQVLISNGSLSQVRTSSLGAGEMPAVTFLDDETYLIAGTEGENISESSTGIVFRGRWGEEPDVAFRVTRAHISALALTENREYPLVLGTEGSLGQIILASLDGSQIQRFELGDRAEKIHYRRFAPLGGDMLGVGAFGAHVLVRGSTAEAVELVLPPEWSSCPSGPPSTCGVPKSRRDATAISGADDRAFFLHAECVDGIHTVNSDFCLSLVPFAEGFAIRDAARRAHCEAERGDVQVEELDFAAGLGRVGDVLTVGGECGMLFEACLDPSKCE